MRLYANPAAFRAAIDDRLRAYAARTGALMMVVRRQAALERLMVRLMKVAPGQWALKGGLALDTRLGARARSSMDMDIDHQQGAAAAHEDLLRAVAEELGDWFAFVITGRREIHRPGAGEMPPPFVEPLGRRRWRIDTEVFQTLTMAYSLKRASIPQGHDDRRVLNRCRCDRPSFRYLASRPAVSFAKSLDRQAATWAGFSVLVGLERENHGVLRGDPAAPRSRRDSAGMDRAGDPLPHP